MSTLLFSIKTLFIVHIATQLHNFEHADLFLLYNSVKIKTSLHISKPGITAGFYAKLLNMRLSMISLLQSGYQYYLIFQIIL